MATKSRLAACALMLGLLCAAAGFARADLPAPLPPVESIEFGPQGQFIVNGEPFLPIMSWAQHPDNRWNSFANLRSLNFNTFMGNQVTPLEQAQAAEAVGGYGVVSSSQTQEVAAAAGHPYLLAWSHWDEPDLPQRSNDSGWEPRRTPAQVAAHYQWYQDRGIDRPVFLTFTAHFMEEFRSRYSAEKQAELYPAYIAHADVVGYDHYPIYGHGRPNWLNRVASGVTQLVDLAEGRPVYAWIETSKGSRWMTYERQPDVLPIHTRYEVWGALIRGATAIGYFTHAWEPVFTEFAPTPEMQDELRRLNAQITELAPMILAPPSEREISIDMTAVPGGVALTSHFKATEHDGSLWIFAQNTDLGHNAHLLGQFDPIYPRDGIATIHVEGLQAGAPVLVPGPLGYTAIPAEDGYFHDSFDALGERIYRILHYSLAEPEPIPGDINRDGVVDLDDFAILKANFGTVGNATWEMGDLNGDGNVDLDDFMILKNNFGRQNAGH